MYVRHMIEVVAEDGRVLISAERRTFIPRHAGRAITALSSNAISDLSVEEADQATMIARDVEGQFHARRTMAEDREIMATLDSPPTS